MKQIARFLALAIGTGFSALFAASVLAGKWTVDVYGDDPINNRTRTSTPADESLVAVASQRRALGELAAFVQDSAIVLGNCQTQLGFSTMCVRRYGSGGALDAAFGSTGTYFETAFEGSTAAAIAVQQDRKIVVTGSCIDPNDLVSEFCVIRLTADGQRDPSFGNGGAVSLRPSPQNNAALNVAIDDNGRIVAAGYCGTPRIGCVARLTPSGQLDTSFAGMGWRWINNDPGIATSISAIAINDVAESIFLGGTCEVTGFQPVLCVSKLAFDGSANTLFGSQGRQFVSFGAIASRLVAMEVQKNGAVFLAGTCGNDGDSRGFCYERLKPDGATDLRYQGGTVRYITNYNNSVLTGTLNHPDGLIELWGRCQNFDEKPLLCNLTLNPDGSLARTHPMVFLGSPEHMTNIRFARASDYRVFMGHEIGTPGSGTSARNFDWTIQRLSLIEEFGQRCDLDVDGDKYVLRNDALIASRVAAGFVDNAVTATAASPVFDAVRDTWPKIRNFLRDECNIRRAGSAN